MPNIKDAIYSRSQSFAPLAALIGVRMFDVTAKPVPPQTTVPMPYVTYQIVSGDRHHVMSRDTLGRPRVQFDSFGTTRASAEDVNTQVVAAFNRWKGTVAGVVVKESVIESDGIDVQSDDLTLIPRVTSEAFITYEL